MDITIYQVNMSRDKNRVLLLYWSFMIMVFGYYQETEKIYRPERNPEGSDTQESSHLHYGIV